MKIKKSPLTIGRLAKAAGVNIETVRHYQRQNLIKEPHKPESGFRQYPIETIDRIRFVKRAKQLGFSLKEIAQLLFLGNENCNDIQALAEEKQKLINQQIEGLLTIQSALGNIISSCKKNPSGDHCALFEALSLKDFLNDVPTTK